MVEYKAHTLAAFVHNHAEQAKQTLDGIAGVVTLGALMDMLPAVSAILSVIWLAIRIYETDTVQELLGKDKAKESDNE